MISSRNLLKYQKILGNAYAHSKNTDEFKTGIQSAGTHLRSAVCGTFLFENKCSIRDIRICHHYTYGGTSLWWETSWTKSSFTLRNPHDKTAGYNWRLDGDFITALYKDPDIKKNLIPKEILFFANIHNKTELWICDPAASILLGEDPCLTKVETPDSK